MKASSKHFFEQTMLPHLAASYHFALSLLGHTQNAEDAVQEAFIRALRAINQFSGNNSKAWLMVIVRNVCMTQLKQLKNSKVMYVDSQKLKEKTHQYQVEQSVTAATPESNAIDLSELSSHSKKMHNAIYQLPIEYREIIVLREFQDFNYKQISKIIALPLGTVMSRLSRARRKLRDILTSEITDNKKGDNHEM
jgi:RNA polymerase sigma-70 factor (ECF subfamily)